jgi:hypothetical protein
MNKELLNILISFYEEIEEQEKLYKTSKEQNKDEETLRQIEDRLTAIKAVTERLRYSLYLNLKMIYENKMVE